MAVVGNLSIGMVVSTASLSKGLKRGEVLIDGFVSRARGLGIGLQGAIMGGLAGAGVVGMFVKAAGAASDLNEQVSATGVFFGKAASIITDDADKMAKQFGTVRSEYLQSANDMAPMLRRIAQTDEATADLSVSLMRLASDVSSIKNASMGEVLSAISSGLRGEADPLERFGVILTDATIKAEAFRMGLYNGKGELSDQAKLQARLAVITKDLAYANGDLARTFDGVANQSRSFGGRFQYMLEEAGKAFEPITQALLFIGNNALMAISDGFEASKAAVADWAASAVKAGGFFDTSLKYIGAGIAGVADAMIVLRAVWASAADYMTLHADRIKDAISGVKQVLIDSINPMHAFSVKFGGMADMLTKNTAKPARDGFKDLYEKNLAETTLPSKKITAFFDGLRAKLTKEEEETAAAVAAEVPKPIADAMKPTPKPGAKGKALAEAMDAGSKEAYSAIVQANVKAPGQDAAKQLVSVNQQQLNVGQASLAALKAIHTKLGAPSSNPVAVAI